METINLIGRIFTHIAGWIGILVIIFAIILVILSIIPHGEKIEKMLELIEKTIFLLGIVFTIFLYVGFLFKDISKENNKTLIEIEYSSDLYYDKETHIIYCVTDKTITPLYNTDGSFKLYTED